MTAAPVNAVYRSALFVDFDNIYIRLAEQDQGIANIFATQPQQWVGWLEDSLPFYGASKPDFQRRILVRRCYLNPKSFGKYRPYLIRAAFETVDCPVLTAGGKTSADVHMVLDILELLDHRVFFDEFIILSGDADFTPVLVKLRKCDRRTSVLAVGTSSPAYRAASDFVIDQDAFLEEALGASEAAADEVKPTGVESTTLTEELLNKCSELIQDHVTRADGPVSMAILAARIRTACPQLSGDWGGVGTFKTLLGRLDLGKLRTSSVTPGYVYDPDQHIPPSGTEVQEEEALFFEKDPRLAEFARKVSQLTDTPYLTPEHYATLYQVIAGEINENGYHLTAVSKAVRDKCKEMHIPVGRQHINFILRGIAFAGHRFGVEREEPRVLAAKLFRNTLTLCDKAQLVLTDEEVEMIKAWLIPASLDDAET